MTHSRWLLALLLTCLLLPMLASAAGRSGPYVVGGLMLDAVTGLDYNGTTFDGDATDTWLAAGKSRTGGTLGAGYQFAPGGQFVLMVEAGKDMGADLHMSLTNRYTSQSNAYDEATRRWQLQRDWYVALKPGWQVSPSTTLYLSIAHHRGSARLDNEITECLSGICDSLSLETISKKTHGTGIGLGIQSALSEHWFVRAEVERIDVGRVEFALSDQGNPPISQRDQLDATHTTGRVMIGWRF